MLLLQALQRIRDDHPCMSTILIWYYSKLAGREDEKRQKEMDNNGSQSEEKRSTTLSVNCCFVA